MGAYKVYKTNVGYFTTVVDDDIYNYFNEYGAGQWITDRGATTLTAAGERLLNSGILRGSYNTFLVPSTLPDAHNFITQPYILLTDFFPNTVRRVYNFNILERAAYHFTCETGEHTNIIYTLSFHDYSIPTNRSTDLIKDGEPIFEDLATVYCMPLGLTGNDDSESNDTTQISIQFYVFDSEMENGLIITFNFRDPEKSYLKRSDWTFDRMTTISRTFIDDYKEWIDGVIPIEPTDDDTIDPYIAGGISGTGGGGGHFDNTSTPVDFPSLPTLSAVDTGFITLFNPTLSELKNLANYMWGSLFDVSTWKKIFADPMDAILGLSIVPVAVPDGGSHQVTVGNISTGVYMNVASSQYVEVDCGSIIVDEFWGAYLDYEPYTKCEIHLPYIGTHPLNIDDVMKKTVTVKYHVDVLSGACTAYVKCGESVLYEFVGQCTESIPITGKDWTNVVNGAISIAASIGTMVATGGMSAPLTAGTVAGISNIASTSANIIKPSVEKSNSISGSGGMLGIQKPYLILTRPRQALPTNQNKFMGYPSFITRNLGQLSGYTEIEMIHLENVPASQTELNEIEQLLKAGVIL